MNNTYTAHRELKALLTEALTVLSPSRVALGAGCTPSSIEVWMRRPSFQVMARTANETLPRLRYWTDWVDGYQAELDEIRRLEADAMACWENRIEELRARLDVAASQFSMKQLALGCEIPERRLLLWRLGHVVDLYLDDLARALGHLRHIDAWPAEPNAPEAPETLQHVAVTTDGMTRYDLV
ncbi:MAG: hypothetical protein K0R39_2407 [Symbiobacteriaceae bacterium]|jgi:hypothetical protein|nr:hypothetical protein [Symbiobacteriaceae bacterium]